jgi:prefoldin subunit 5
MLLCASVATLVASSTVLAQARGNSGLPAGSGSPMADLQAQISSLQQQMNTLSAAGQDVSTLKQQLQTLQSQLTALSSQLTTLSTLQTQVKTLTSQLETLAAESTSSSYASLAVFDNKNQMLGEVVGVDDNVPWVALSAGDYAVVLQVFPQQLIGQNLWFDAANCSGSPYIAGLTLNRGANVFALAAVSEPGGVIYAAHPAAQPAKRSAQWSLRDSSGVCFNQGTFSQTVLPASPVFTLDTMFQRPYHVR